MTHAELRQAVIDGYGGACVACGESDPDVLQIDHVAGGGRQERQHLRGGKFYHYLLIHDFPQHYQLLCGNCHARKTRQDRHGARMDDDNSHGTKRTHISSLQNGDNPMETHTKTEMSERASMVTPQKGKKIQINPSIPLDMRRWLDDECAQTKKSQGEILADLWRRDQQHTQRDATLISTITVQGNTLSQQLIRDLPTAVADMVVRHVRLPSHPFPSVPRGWQRWQAWACVVLVLHLLDWVMAWPYGYPLSVYAYVWWANASAWALASPWYDALPFFGLFGLGLMLPFGLIIYTWLGRRS